MGGSAGLRCLYHGAVLHNSGRNRASHTRPHPLRRTPPALRKAGDEFSRRTVLRPARDGKPSPDCSSSNPGAARVERNPAAAAQNRLGCPPLTLLHSIEV